MRWFYWDGLIIVSVKLIKNNKSGAGIKEFDINRVVKSSLKNNYTNPVDRWISTKETQESICIHL